MTQKRVMLPCYAAVQLQEPHRSHLWPDMWSPQTAQWYCPGLRQLKFKSIEQVEEWLN